jgi:hypothetical protein
MDKVYPQFRMRKSPVYSCGVALKIQKDFSVPETKIVCPGWQGYTEWYYRGLFNSDETVSSFLFNHAYGTGEYSLVGTVNEIKMNKKTNIHWSLTIAMEKK